MIFSRAKDIGPLVFMVSSAVSVLSSLTKLSKDSCERFCVCSDITLEAGDASFRAHRAVLHARCGRLREMLEEAELDGDPKVQIEK